MIIYVYCMMQIRERTGRGGNSGVGSDNEEENGGVVSSKIMGHDK